MRHEPRSPRDRIIELYTRPKPAYTNAEVMRLLGMSEADVQQAMTGLVFGPEQNDQGATVIRWEDVAHLALEEWTPRMVQAGLGRRASALLPALNQHCLIRVSLPVYLIRYLDFRARQESTNRLPRNASDIIEALLHNDADSGEAPTIDLDIPGFFMALRYPYYDARASATFHRCRYCDISITEPTRAVCRACEQRHEPNEHLGEYGLPELEESR